MVRNSQGGHNKESKKRERPHEKRRKRMRQMPPK